MSKADMNRDPIVEEVHRVRRKIWEECGRDMNRLFKRLKAQESEDRDRIITLSEFNRLTGREKPTRSRRRSRQGQR